MRLKKLSAIILSITILFQSLSFTKVQAYENFDENISKRMIDKSVNKSIDISLNTGSELSTSLNTSSNAGKKTRIDKHLAEDKNQKGSITSAFDEDLKKLEKQIQSVNDEKKLQESVSEEANDYRLIVELQGEPVISEAISRGLKFEELDESIIEEATERIQEEQQMALSDLSTLSSEESSLEISKTQEFPTYSVNFNGFVVKGQKDDIELLKQKPYVKNVYISQEYERPQLKNSNTAIGSSYAWDTLGYKGENTVIAIIDTGVDYTHEAMQLDANAEKKYDRSSIDRLIAEHGLKGKYFTEKVPYGYNYYDHNSNTFDSYGSMHGMHVAGISAANSAKTGIKGVAPNAQILAMKVFSDDVQYPTTFTDVWLKALDDAIKLKADAINMSLGAPAGILSSDGNSLEEDAIARAKKAGILISISAGNDGHIMSGHHLKGSANAENPDTALIASPSLFGDSLSVASTDNAVKYSTYMNFTKSDSSKAKHKISITRGINSPESVTATPVHLKDGDEEEYEKHGDLTGKIIIIKVDEEKQKDDHSHSHADTEENSDVQADPQTPVAENTPENTAGESTANSSTSENTMTENSSESTVSENAASKNTTSASITESNIALAVQENSTDALDGESTQKEQTEEEKAEETRTEEVQAKEEQAEEKQTKEEQTEEEQTEELITKEESLDKKKEEHDHKHKKMGLLDKIELAKSKNPSAIVLYSEHLNVINLTNMLNNAFTRPSHTIAMIGNDAATEIFSELEKNPDFKITLSAKLEAETDLNSGRISRFSSWGPGPDLRMKPELSAPGGNIYSTIEDNQYRSLSGTSMASPHVAGAAAIMKQALKERGVSEDKIVEKIKLHLMNTALPIHYDANHLAFVRQQGAGLMKLDKALKTKVSVTATSEADNTQDGKLELGEIKTKGFDYSLHFENNADDTKRFKLKYVIVYDNIQNGKLTLEPKSKEIQPVQETILEIDAKSSKSFDLNLDLSSHDEILEHQFVEGFIQLEDLDSNSNEKIDLSVPFLGFYGDWSKGYAIDAFEIKESNIATKRDAQVIINQSVNSESSMFVTPAGSTLPVRDDIMYFSPNSLRFQKKNMFPSFGLRLGVLRNLDFVEYSILDLKTGKPLKVLGKNYNIRKMNRLAFRPSFITMPDSQWDGTIDDYEVKQGDVFLYQIKANLNNGLREDMEQIYQYKVALDSAIPQITDNSKITVEKLSNGKNRLLFKVQDTDSGLEDVYLQAVYFIDIEESQKQKKEVVVNPEVTNGEYDKEKVAPRYKQSVAIKFIDPNDPFFKLLKVDPSMILTPQDGKLHVPEDYFTRYNTKYVYCDIRGHYRDEIEISVDIKSYEEYLSIYVSDYCANSLGYYMHLGKDLSSHKISFDSYYVNLKPNGATVTINDVPLKDDNIEATGKSRVSIAFLKKDNVLTKVKLSNIKGDDFLIINNTLSDEMKHKYNASYDEFSLSFDLEALDGNYEIMTWTQKLIPESEMASVSFENFDFSKFEDAQLKIASDKNMQDVKIINTSNQSVKLPKSNIYISAKFLQKEDISLIEVVTGKKPTLLLEALNPKEFNDLKNTYYLPEPKKTEFFAKFELKDHVNFNILYGGNHNGNAGGLPFDFENNNSSGSNSGAGSNTGSKYPIIVLNSPSLLDIKTERDITKEGLLIEGFVGHMKGDLKSLKYSFIDPYGNPLSEAIEIPKSKIKKEEIHFHTKNKEIFHGDGYVFRTHIMPTAFHVNLRLEAISTDGQRASIVRRLFFDDQAAKLSYEVLDRKLSDDSATIKIKSNDNSFKINLYKNNSLIDAVDLSTKSYESKDAKIEKEIKVPLKLGQNKIELKALDLSFHESVKTLYIYRIK